MKNSKGEVALILIIALVCCLTVIGLLETSNLKAPNKVDVLSTYELHTSGTITRIISPYKRVSLEILDENGNFHRVFVAKWCPGIETKNLIGMKVNMTTTVIRYSGVIFDDTDLISSTSIDGLNSSNLCN